MYKHDLSEPYGMNGFDKTIKDIALNLEDGKNEFEFKVVDLGGHVTKKTIVIEKEKDDSGDTESTIAVMKDLVDQYEENGDIKSHDTAKLLNMQLTTIGYFENSGAMNKAINHMNTFKQLLAFYQNNSQLTDDAAETLMKHADNLIKEWQ